MDVNKYGTQNEALEPSILKPIQSCTIQMRLFRILNTRRASGIVCHGFLLTFEYFKFNSILNSVELV